MRVFPGVSHGHPMVMGLLMRAANNRVVAVKALQGLPMVKLRRYIACVLIVTLGATMASPPVGAELITSEQSQDPESVDPRTRIARVLNRADVGAYLESKGVRRDQIDLRVAALTDEEAQALADRMDEALAGGADDPVSMLVMTLFGIVVLIGYLAVGIVLGVVWLLKKVFGDTEDQRVAAPKSAEEERIAAYHYAGTVSIGDVVPVGRLYVDKTGFPVPATTPPDKGGWLIVNLAAPTPRGGRSYKLRAEVNCHTGVLTVTRPSYLTDRENGFGNGVFGDTLPNEERLPDTLVVDKPSAALTLAANHICN